jgi:hypothetical protein
MKFSITIQNQKGLIQMNSLWYFGYLNTLANENGNMRSHNQYEIQNLLQEWQKPIKTKKDNNTLLTTLQRQKGFR